jgi:hypothetical protein
MSRKTARNLNHKPDETRKAVAIKNHEGRLEAARKLQKRATTNPARVPALPFTNRKTHRAHVKKTRLNPAYYLEVAAE